MKSESNPPKKGVWFKTPNHKIPNLNIPKLKITFHNGTEITIFPMCDLDEWYIDQLISTRWMYMLSRRSRFIKRRGLELLPNIPNIVRWPLDLAALTNLLLRLYIYIRLGEMSWLIYYLFYILYIIIYSFYSFIIYLNFICYRIGYSGN